jgi:hypothetical protein
MYCKFCTFDECFEYSTGVKTAYDTAILIIRELDMFNLNGMWCSESGVAPYDSRKMLKISMSPMNNNLFTAEFGIISGGSLSGVYDMSGVVGEKYVDGCHHRPIAIVGDVNGEMITWQGNYSVIHDYNGPANRMCMGYRALVVKTSNDGIEGFARCGHAK